MSDNKVFSPGTFCWVELGTSDRPKACSFYSELLGWASQDQDMGDMGIYTVLTLDDGNIAGVYNLTDEMAQQGVPPHWTSYVKVTSADESAEKVDELGGTVIMKPFDVPNVGRMAVAQDPTGAHFSLFQAGAHTGAAPRDNKPGMFCWNERARFLQRTFWLDYPRPRHGSDGRLHHFYERRENGRWHDPAQ